jgi:hypothetical protein
MICVSAYPIHGKCMDMYVHVHMNMCVYVLMYVDTHGRTSRHFVPVTKQLKKICWC